MRLLRSGFVLLAALGASVSACRGGGTTSDSNGDVSLAARVASALGFDTPYDSTRDVKGMPRYTTRTFNAEERALLHDAFGVEDPAKLYVADSSENGLLKYDTRVKRCLECFVNSYGIGFVSVRKPDETWEQVEQRVYHMKRKDFPASVLVESISLSLLDPLVRPQFEQMLMDAKRAGFNVDVVATYRSPLREALLMSEGRARTHTLTSTHSYGRAIDVTVNGGNIRRANTRLAWIAFRRWLVAYDKQQFRILGAPEHSWDWRHIEIPSDAIGFRSIDAALAAARKCTGVNADPAACTFQANLPASPAAR